VINAGLKEKNAGIREMFHFRYSPHFPKDTAVARRVPCVCDSCLAQLESKCATNVDPTTQPRFQEAAGCFFEHIVGDLNAWNTFTVLLQTVKDKVTKEWVEQAFMVPIVEKVLRSGLTVRADAIEEEIKVGGYGAIGSDGDEGFFLIQFTSTPFLLQSPSPVFGCHIDPNTNKQEPMPAGALVVKAKGYSRIHRAPGWYEPVDPREEEQYYWIQHIASGDVAVQEHGDSFNLRAEPCVIANKLFPERCRLLERKEFKRILYEIHVMGKLDYIQIDPEDCVRERMNEDGDSDSEEDEDEEASEIEEESEEESEEDECS
jgi:hypothetical protein